MEFVDSVCSMDELKRFLPEGLPLGMMKEFEESNRNALLVRQSFIDLRDNFWQAAHLYSEVNCKGTQFTPFCLFVVFGSIRF